MRRIEVRSGMLAELQPVPCPERTVVVELGDLVNLDLRRVHREFWRQLEERRVRPERARQVNHLDPARQEALGHFLQR